jgi:predicted MFS family arabinose efflux permease
MDYRLWVLALGTFAIGTDSYVVAGILPQVATSFDTTIAAAAQFVSVYSLSYGVLTPVMATLTANWPRRRVLLFGLAAFVASNVLTAMAPTFGLALGSRALAGLGGAVFTPAASAAATVMAGAERRGRALAIVLAGLSAATALGAPIGTVVASLGDWHSTLWFVAALGALAGAGVLAWIPDTAPAPRIGLRARLAPLADARVATTLATTLLVMLGVFVVYTYISVVFDRATLGSGAVLAALMATWGLAATAGSLKAGGLTDRFGNRRVLNAAVAILAADFALLPWTSAALPSGALALAVWGMFGWGSVVAQQHRLVGLDPAKAPILLALNASAIYLGIAGSGALGALLLRTIDPHLLPLLGAVLIAGGGVTGELAHRLGAGRAVLTSGRAPLPPRAGARRSAGRSSLSSDRPPEGRRPAG